MNRKVTTANFHQSVFLAGQTIGNQLPSTRMMASQHWPMKTSPYGLVVTIKGQDCLVPWANVSACSLGEELSEAKVKPLTAAEVKKAEGLQNVDK